MKLYISKLKMWKHMQMLTMMIQTLHMTLYDRGNQRLLLSVIFALCMGIKHVYDIAKMSDVYIT